MNELTKKYVDEISLTVRTPKEELELKAEERGGVIRVEDIYEEYNGGRELEGRAYHFKDRPYAFLSADRVRAAGLPFPA
jgi:hypothetical protein